MVILEDIYIQERGYFSCVSNENVHFQRFFFLRKKVGLDVRTPDLASSELVCQHKFTS